MTSLTLPMPPSLNRLYRSVGSGRVLISKEGRAYKQETTLLARLATDAILEGELIVTARFYNTRMDLDNACKALFDSLNGVVWHDDSQVIELHSYKLRDTGEARVEMVIDKET